MPKKQVSRTRKRVTNIQGDLQTLRDDVTDLSQQLENLLSDAGSDAVDQVRTRLNDAKARIDGLISDAGAKGIELRDNLVDGVEESVREHPMMTLAAAVGFGFVLSAALRR